MIGKYALSKWCLHIQSLFLAEKLNFPKDYVNSYQKFILPTSERVVILSNSEDKEICDIDTISQTWSFIRYIEIIGKKSIETFDPWQKVQL